MGLHSGAPQSQDQQPAFPALGHTPIEASPLALAQDLTAAGQARTWSGASVAVHLFGSSLASWYFLPRDAVAVEIPVHPDLRARDGAYALDLVRWAVLETAAAGGRWLVLAFCLTDWRTPVGFYLFGYSLPAACSWGAVYFNAWLRLKEAGVREGMSCRG